MKNTLVRFLPIALLTAVSAFSQNINGTFTGVISDATGGVTPNANITARNVATAAMFSAKSDEVGAYVLRNIPVGVYDITGELPGFQKFEA